MAAFKRLRPATLLKKRLWHRCFHVNFAKFLRTPFSQNTSRRLLLLIKANTSIPAEKDQKIKDFVFSGEMKVN